MDKNNGIMIFKDIFEYYKDGDLNEEGFCELMMLIYETKWGTEPDINNIQNRMCKTIWKGLRHSIKKSVRNAKYQNNKSTLQEVKSTEFDTPQIEENVEIENKAVLNPQNIQDDNLYHPEEESGSNGLKMGKNEVKQNIPIAEEKPIIKIAANKQSSDTERVQELINTDDDFYTAYSRYINANIDYINDPTGRCTANSKEMAKVRLQAELDKHHIIFNKDIMEMIDRDINEIIQIRNIDVA